MNHHLSFFCISVCAATFSFAQAQQSETPLLTIGDKTISLEEFNYIYNKNNEVSQYRISPREYLDLFINYKLKVAEAQSLGLDTTKSYRDECNYYLDELSSDRYIDSAAIRAAHSEIYQRSKYEIDASHILIQARSNASPEDTLRAYNRIVEARAKIMAGADFADIAREYSEDPSGKASGGSLGAFSTMQMVEPFETMAYTTPVDSVSPIFRTRFGYHILRVNARRPWSGEISVAHIMKMAPKDAPQADRDKAKAAIDSVYAKILAGENFEKLAIQESDDKQTGVKGGVMPWFGKGQIVKEFADASFALENDGDISEPILTDFGWHIIKRLAKRTERDSMVIERMIYRASAGGAHKIASVGKNAVAQKLKKEYNFKWNLDARKKFAAVQYGILPDSVKQKKLSEIAEPLATFDGGEIRSTDRLVWTKQRLEDENFERFAQDAIFAYDKSQLTTKDRQFGYVMQEYYDGLLVFEINQRTIWSETPSDSLQMQALYESNGARYSTGGTFEGTIYICNDSTTAKKMLSFIASGKTAKAKKLAYQVIEGTQMQGGQLDDLIWPNIPSPYVVLDGKVVSGQLLDFEQARGMLLSDLQQRREVVWMKELRAKYKPTVIEKNFK